MRKRTVLDCERASAGRSRPTALGTHAAEGEREREGDIVPHDDPEPIATCVQAHPPTHTRAKPGPPRSRRGYSKEPVDRQHRGLHGPQRPAQARAPLRGANCSAGNLLVIPTIFSGIHSSSLRCLCLVMARPR